jgi:hypothetical protein
MVRIPERKKALNPIGKIVSQVLNLVSTSTFTYLIQIDAIRRR